MTIHTFAFLLSAVLSVGIAANIISIILMARSRRRIAELLEHRGEAR